QQPPVVEPKAEVVQAEELPVVAVERRLPVAVVVPTEVMREAAVMAEQRRPQGVAAVLEAVLEAAQQKAAVERRLPVAVVVPAEVMREATAMAAQRRPQQGVAAVLVP